MIDTTQLPASLYDANLPLPNVYFVTVTHVTAATTTLYVAADGAGAAVQKVRRHCRDTLGFMPYRSTSDIKMRRFRLGDYLENPQGLQEAAETAEAMGERSTLKALQGRHKEVERLVAELATAQQEQADMRWADVEEQLGEALRQVG